MSEGSKNPSFRRARLITWVRPVLVSFIFATGWPNDLSAAGPESIQQELHALKLEFQRLQTEGREEEAFAVLDRMFDLDPEHPKNVGAIVDCYKNTQEFDVAERELRSRAEEGPALSYGLGLLEFFKREYAASEELFRSALAGYEALGHLPGQASSHQFLGNALWAGRRSDACLVEYRAARDLFERLEDLSAVAEVLNRLSFVHRRKDMNDEALASARSAVLYAERAENLGAQGRAWLKVGEALEAKGLHEKAREAFENAFEVQRLGADRLGQALTHKRIAQSYIRNGQDPRAAEHLLETLRLAESMDHANLAAETRITLAGHYLEVGRESEGVELLRVVLARQEVLISRWSGPRARYTLGKALLKSGELRAARDELELALESARKVKYRRIEADARTSMSQILIATGSLTQALAHQERALDLYRELTMRPRELRALNNLGLIYYRMGALPAAKQYLHQGLELAEELSDRGMEALLRYNLSLTLVAQGHFDEALDEQRRAMALREEIDDPRQIAFSHVNAAVTLWHSGDREGAFSELELALEGFRTPHHRDREGEALALYIRAGLLRELGRLDEALAAYGEAIEVAREFQSQAHLWLAHAGRADVFRSMNRDAKALEEYDRALEVIESLRGRLESGEFKMRYFASVADVYDRAIALQVVSEPQPAARGLHTVERARARSLSDLLVEARALPRVGLPAPLAERERKLTDRVGAAYLSLTEAKDEEARKAAMERLTDADQELQSFKVEVRRSAPQYADVVYPRPSRLREIRQDVLRDDETLLRYFASDTQTLLWTVNKRQASFHELPHPDELAAQVAEFLERVGKPGVHVGDDATRRADAKAEALGRTLLVSKPPAGHRLLVVPDGPLHYLPFEALRFDDRYVVEDHEVVTVPSATILTLMRDHPPEVADGGFLGVGDTLPAPDDPRFGPLPFSGQALDRIVSLFPADRTTLLKGNDSTKARLLRELQTRFRFLHFATHGWLDRDLPKYYGLRLSPSSTGGEPEFLSLDDVFALELQSELVVLSACQSGLGEQLRGEGLVGLARAFLYAGARSLIVSLWAINDRSTAEFMEGFYGKLAQGRTIPEALRLAKLDFIDSDIPARREPYRWAPFVLVGDPGRTPVVLNPPPAGATVTGSSRSPKP